MVAFVHTQALTAAGARALAACLAAHPTLQELLIGRNELGTDGEGR
jgi:hypothetical protein